MTEPVEPPPLTIGEFARRSRLSRTSLRDREPRSAWLEVRERAVPEQLVLAERRSLSLAELEGWLRATKRRLVAAAHGYGGMVAPLFVIFHGEVSQDSDGPVEVCVPVDRSRAAARDPALRRESAHREAYVRVTKARFEVLQILSAYDAVAAWISAHGRCWAGPPREVYLPGVDPHGAAPTDEVCDVACPVDSRA